MSKHLPGRGYKGFRHHQTTVRGVVYKLRAPGTLVNLPRSGRPAEISLGCRARSSKKSPKISGKCPRSCWSFWLQLKSVFMFLQQDTETLDMGDFSGRAERYKTLQRYISAHLTFVKKGPFVKTILQQHIMPALKQCWQWDGIETFYCLGTWAMSYYQNFSSQETLFASGYVTHSQF